MTKSHKRPSPSREPRHAAPARDSRRAASGLAISVERWMPRVAVLLVALYGLYWLVKALTVHRLGNYAVETDFYWKYGPAAAALKEGRVLIEHFDSKGWGYPLVLASVSFLGLDLFRSGQLIGIVSACAAAWCVFHLHRRLLGSTLALLSLLLLIANPTFLANTYEVGTDMFFFAVVIGSIALLLGPGRTGWKPVLASGLLGGWAFTTRYNGLFLWPGALLSILAIRPKAPDAGAPQSAGTRWRGAALWSAGFVAAALPWLIANAAHTGNPLTNNNYTNVGYAVYGEGNWERFFYGSDRKIHSFADVVRLDPGRFAGAMVRNAVEHARRDVTELMGTVWGLLAVAGIVLAALERRERLWVAYLAFGLLYFLTLVPVFYGARFSLPMLSIYTALAVAPLGWRRLSDRLAGVERQFPARVFAFLLLWMPGALLAYAHTEDPRNPEALQAGPYETLDAATYLRQHGRGQGLLARKPHVAFVAGLRFVPIPELDSAAALHDLAIRSGARFLLVSGAELGLRAALRPFAEPNARIPGFQLVFESPGALVYEVLR